MNRSLYGFLVALFIFPLIYQAGFAETSREKSQALEIEGPHPELQTKPVPEIKPIDSKVPEIPKEIKRTGLTTAEEEELRQEERRLARGEITQTEFEMKKDSLYRDSNIKF